MQRRDFLKMLGGAGLAATLPGLMLRPASASSAEPFDQLVLLTISASGGWDQSSFWDPRNNPEVNRYANDRQAANSGNIWCAPMGENIAFTEKYHQDMLVFNGVDLRTNGHDGARLTQSSGALSGMPAVAALYAAIHGAGLPMPWLFAGGESENQGIQPYTQLPSSSEMLQMADTNRMSETSLYFRRSDMSIIEKYRLQRLQAQQAQSSNLPFTQRKMDELYQARTSRGMMDLLKAELESAGDIDTVDLAGDAHNRISQAHRFLIAAKAGVCVTGSISTGYGYDSHRNHDASHEVGTRYLTRLLDYVWTKAAAMGIDDRLVVYVTSDVGRTPRYNSNNGKDHWSNGHAMIMMRYQDWTNRVVGISGPKHEKLMINPATLQLDPEGVRLETGHVQMALRQILGIEDHQLAQKFAINLPEIDLFGSASSPVNV